VLQRQIHQSRFPSNSYLAVALPAALRAGVALAVLTALGAPAGAVSAGFPQDSRPVDLPELSRPVPLIRPAKPRTPAAAPAAAMPAPLVGGAKPAVKTAAKPALGAPGQPARPKLPMTIMISLDHQQLTLYSGDQPIAHSRVSSGQKGRATPTGVFSIIQKDRFHRSNLYDDAPMYYMQRITWSGVALHQGIVPNYPASHGCVRLPEAFAKQLWGTTNLGVRVIITNGETAPREFAHEKLFVPKAPDVVATTPNTLDAVNQAWKIAQLGGNVPMMGATATDIVNPPALEPPRPAARPVKSSPISVFVSRKESKVFVRKGFEPLFDAPVEIDRADQPFGTHVFTASGGQDGAGLRWTAVSVSSGKVTPNGAQPAASVLDRITIPQDTLDRISEMAGNGMSLIVTDHGLGPETGLGTDFIVLTR